MGLSGNLKTVSFSDILQLLNMGDRTGTFKISKGDVEKKIFFKNGKIIHALSSKREDLLENVLLKKKKLSRRDLQKAKELQEETGKSLASTLVYLNMVPKDEIANFIKLQIQEIIFDVFSWEEGDFEFMENDLPNTDHIISALNVMNLLMEGTRRIDEWTEIQKNLPPDNTILSTNAEQFAKQNELKMTPEEGQVLSLIDGERSIEEIKEKNADGELATSRAIYGLLTTGLVRESGRKELKRVKRAEREEILEALLNIFETMLEQMKNLFVEKVGRGGTTTYLSVLKKTIESNELLSNIRVDKDGNLDFSNFLELSKDLPEESRFYQVSSSLIELVEAEVKKAKMIMGKNILKQLKKGFREETKEIRERYEPEFQRYGIQKNINKLISTQ